MEKLLDHLWATGLKLQIILRPSLFLSTCCVPDPVPGNHQRRKRKSCCQWKRQTQIILLLSRRAVTEGSGKSCHVVLVCFSVCANYFIIQSKLRELRELRVWPCLGSWRVFKEEETSELDFKGLVFAIWWREVRLSQAEEQACRQGRQHCKDHVPMRLERARGDSQGPAF